MYGPTTETHECPECGTLSPYDDLHPLGDCDECGLDLSFDAFVSPDPEEDWM